MFSACVLIGALRRLSLLQLVSYELMLIVDIRAKNPSLPYLEPTFFISYEADFSAGNCVYSKRKQVICLSWFQMASVSSRMNYYKVSLRDLKLQLCL